MNKEELYKHFKEMNFSVINNNIIYNGKKQEDDDLDTLIYLYFNNEIELSEYKSEIINWYENNKPEETIKEEKIDKTDKIYPIGKDWMKNLLYDSKGNIKKCIINTVIYFNSDEKYKDKFSFNDFTKIENFDKKEIQDYMVEYFRLDMESNLGYNTKDLVESVIKILTHNNTFHPFKEKIESLIWDGKERAETLFIDFIGAPDTKLNRRMSKNWLYGMIKRIYEPGCAFDYMLIAYDPKGGTGKSKIVERLVEVLNPDYGYSSSITCNVSDKDNVDKLNRCVVVAFEELADFDKKELPQVKTFISTRYDTARLSYDKRSGTFNRHCVFYGNSNEEFFLNDYSSPNECERRFWVMECNGDNNRNEAWWNKHLPDEYLLQVWAEMYHWYLKDKNMSVMLNPEEKEELRLIQNNHKKINFEDVLTEKILYVLDNIYSEEYFESMFDCNNLLQNGISNTYKTGYYINKIPVTWLKNWIQTNLKSNITTQKLTYILSSEWEYKKARYNNISMYCYVRIKTKLNKKEDNNIKQTDTLPF